MAFGTRGIPAPLFGPGVDPTQVDARCSRPAQCFGQERGLGTFDHPAVMGPTGPGGFEGSIVVGVADGAPGYRKTRSMPS